MIHSLAGGYPVAIYFLVPKLLQHWKAIVEPEVMPLGSKQIPFLSLYHLTPASK